METKTIEREHEITPISQATLEEVIEYRLHELKHPLSSFISDASLFIGTIDQIEEDLRKKLERSVSRYHLAIKLINQGLGRVDNAQNLEQRQRYADLVRRAVYSVHLNGDLEEFKTSEHISKIVDRLKHNQETARDHVSKIDITIPKSENLYTLLDYLTHKTRISPENKLVGVSCKIEDGTRKMEISIDDLANIYSVLTNNARQALNETGKMEISAGLEGDYLRFSVKDDGRGISRDLLSRVGQPGETHGKEYGTGFGLSSVTKILGRYDGRLEISSEEGKGTEVTVYIPKSKIEIEPSKKLGKVVMHLPNGKVDFYHDKDGKPHAGRVIQYYHRDSNHPYEVRAAFYEVRRDDHHSVKIEASAISEDGRIIPYSNEVVGINGETRRLAQEDFKRFLKTLDKLR